VRSHHQSPATEPVTDLYSWHALHCILAVLAGDNAHFHQFSNIYCFFKLVTHFTQSIFHFHVFSTQFHYIFILLLFLVLSSHLLSLSIFYLPIQFYIMLLLTYTSHFCSCCLFNFRLIFLLRMKHTYLLTYLCSWALLEKLPIVRLLKNYELNIQSETYFTDWPVNSSIFNLLSYLSFSASPIFFKFLPYWFSDTFIHSLICCTVYSLSKGGFNWYQ
jgi:hypothetical protein